MATAVLVEWRKLVTTRMWWILLVVMVPYLAAIAAFIAFASTATPAGQPAPTTLDASGVTTLYTLAMPLGYVFPALLGILSVTTEYRHKTITSTLLGETRRTVVVLAKAVVALIIGAVYAVVGLASSTGAAALVLVGTGEQTFLSETDVLAGLGRSALGLALWALIGVAFGLVLRNQIAAIVSLLAFSQLVEPVARVGLAAFEATRGVAKFLPGGAGDALSGSSLFSAGGGADLLTAWQGGLVLLAYAVVLGLVGGIGFVRRDVA